MATRTSLGGATLENVIRSLQMREFQVVSAADHRSAISPLFGHQRTLIKNQPYTTIFGTTGRREYFVESPEWSGQLECKFQNVGGSTDEKMVYVTETLRRTNVEKMALVYGGEYWVKADRGQAIIEWLKSEAKAIKHTHGKQLVILDMDSFFLWACKTWK